ncbi:MAG: hypothetical protein MK081_15925 [Flavobacteriales bacterium]|nr:hypothetical protein [Flavobacteriales bacterium]
MKTQRSGDFHSRFWEPQIARWTSPDPALQFSNPYLGIGNDPINYTDPDGEFIHLVAGALIGGIGNLVLNSGDGDMTFAQGLGYFTVGAIAGGLSAGMGSGMSALMAKKGTFGAGFVGKATVKSVGFSSGAASGAVAGVTNGFVRGLGNALIQGEGFGDALGNSFITAARDGSVGALVGGAIGGIKSASNGGGFFEEGKVKTEVITNDIGRGEQAHEKNCLCQLGERMAEVDGVKNKDGMPMSEKDFRDALGGNPKLHEVKNNKFGKYYASLTGKHFGNRPIEDMSGATLYEHMENGDWVILSRVDVDGNGHATILKEVMRRTYTFKNSDTSFSYKFEVMNPSSSGGFFERWRFSDFKTVNFLTFQAY